MINKYLLIAAIFCLPLLSGNSFSKPGPIYDTSNMLMGYFDDDGNVMIHQFKVLSIKDGGIIYNTSNMPSGSVDDGGNISGSNGGALGSIKDGGIIYNTSNIPVGQVDGDGYVTGQGGISIAKVPDPRIGALMVLGVIKIQ